MPAKKKTNYEIHKEEIIELAGRGSLCHHCLARKVCQDLCKEKEIDPSKSPAPCIEAWSKWSDMNE